MYGMTEGPDEIAAAWEKARQFDLAPKYADIFSVVILGVGEGASAAGLMLQALTAHTAQIPVTVVTGEELPAFVGPDTLVIGCTTGEPGDEATAPAFEEAADRGGKLVIVAVGEAWAARAVTHRAPLLQVPRYLSGPTRTLPLLVSLLGVLHAAGVIANPEQDVSNAMTALITLNEASRTLSDDPVVPNLTEQVARHIERRHIAVQGLGILTPAAAWGRMVLGDVARTFLLPDEHGMTVMNVDTQAAIIALRSAYDPPYALAHARAAAAMWERRGIASVAVPVSGDSRLAAVCWAVGFLGWVAHHLDWGASPPNP